MSYKQLLSTVLTTGASTHVEWGGGPGMLVATALGSSGAVQLQTSPNAGGVWATCLIPGTTVPVEIAVSNLACPFYAGPGRLRALVTVASSTGCSAWIQ